MQNRPSFLLRKPGRLVAFYAFFLLFQTLTQLRTGVIQTRNHRLFEIAVAYHFTSLSFGRYDILLRECCLLVQFPLLPAFSVEYGTPVAVILAKVHLFS